MKQYLYAVHDGENRRAICVRDEASLCINRCMNSQYRIFAMLLHQVLLLDIMLGVLHQINILCHAKCVN